MLGQVGRQVKDKLVRFEPFGSMLPKPKVTAEHGMFSSTMQELRKKRLGSSARSQVGFRMKNAPNT